MDHLYNIVWADDEIDSLLEDMGGLFEKNGLKIVPFNAATPAIEHIRSKSSFVDGIIIDGKFSINGEAFQEEGWSFPGLSEFIRELSGLRRTTGNPLPCWIYTGYGDLLSSKYDQDDLKGFESVVDKKGNYEAKKAWVTSICEKIAQTKTKSFIVRQKNQELFAFCSDDYIGVANEEHLLDILTYNEDDGFPPFIKFRYLLEPTMGLLVKEGIISKKTQGSQILARIDEIKKLKDIPSFVKSGLSQWFDSSPLEHNTEESLEMKEFSNGNAPFIFETLLMAMKTCIVWLKRYIDQHRLNTEKSTIEHQNVVGKELTDGPSSQDIVVNNDENLAGTVVGLLKVKYYNVQVGNEYYQIDKKMVGRVKPGANIRVRIGKDSSGKEIVTELVRVEN